MPLETLFTHPKSFVMAMVRWRKNEDGLSSLSSMIDSFFSGDAFFGKWHKEGLLPAVNVKELPNGFEVQVAAPGLVKGDFDIEINEGLLIIRAEQQRKGKKEEGRFTRREFSYHRFERVFQLPREVEADQIEAVYESGVLKVSLPKREQQPSQMHKHIEIQ
jgi:HSP20 family protein